MKWLAALALTLCRLPSAFAAEPPLPYPYAKVEHKISAERIAAPAPTGGVEILDYREVYYHERYGMLSIAAGKPAVAALLLYSGTSGYIVNAGLIIPADHVVSLSAFLPESAGLLRLLVFDRMPESKTLATFAARPMTATAKYLIGDVWLRTLKRDSQRSRLQMPWEDTLEYFPRLTGARSRWPFWLARIDSSYVVRSKDCSVSYSGLPALETGGRSPVASWPLEIGESLRIRFNMPRGYIQRRAILVLVSTPVSTEFEVRANGFTVPVIPDMTTGVPVLPGIDVRGFLQSGYNEIELRAPTFGQGGRLLRAELWLE
ncbi:MAG: hypothetical protein M3R04_01865 [bacterium]|nr:hypothetical protein [bacterium]